MSRKPDLERKPQLIADIVDFLLDKSLSELTMRTLADHLKVSTFTLVYHFGTKDQLIDDVVEAICEEQSGALKLADIRTASVDDYFDGLRGYWDWTLVPRNRQLQRLEFEAAMTESLRGGENKITRQSLSRWHETTLAGLTALGVPDSIARAESRALANALYGLHYDLIVLGEVGRVTEAFEQTMRGYRVRILALVTARDMKDDAAPVDETQREAASTHYRRSHDSHNV